MVLAESDVLQVRPIYLDHNATTPLDPDVFRAMVPYFTEQFGNASSAENIYGAAASAAVERAREQVARSIGANPTEIVFTGSCTEANNIALLGSIRANPSKRHIITSAIEHPAVLETVNFLEREGYDATILPVTCEGVVRIDDVAAAIRPDTAIVSIMAANNEVGSLQPIAEIGKICADRGVLFHTDLAQSFTYVPVDVRAQNIHLASISAHKAYGPKGVGALYVRTRSPRVKLAPLFFGGGQERGLRPGTLNTPLIVGMGEAVSRANATRTIVRKRAEVQTAMIRDILEAAIPEISVNGSREARLPNSLSFSIEDVEPLALIRLLREKVSFSASSACSSHEVRTSHVLMAMHGDTWRARNAFRLAVGKFTTNEEAGSAAREIAAGIQRLRRMVG